MNTLCKKFPAITLATLGAALLLMLPACDPASSPEASREAEERAGAPNGQEQYIPGAEEEAEERIVEPRHGGVLTELGDGDAYIEFVLDPEAGWVSAYVLDSSARERVRLTTEQIGVIFTMHGDDIPAEERTFSRALQPVESALTGETAGDTAHFETRHERFREAEGFDAIVPTIRVKDVEYTNVSIQYRTEQD